MAWSREPGSWKQLHGVLPHEIVDDVDLSFHISRSCDESEWQSERTACAPKVVKSFRLVELAVHQLLRSYGRAICFSYSLRKKFILSSTSQEASFFIGRERTGRIACKIVRIQGVNYDGAFGLETPSVRWVWTSFSSNPARKTGSARKHCQNKGS